MGEDAPDHFTRKDEWILLRGMTPEMSIDATEEEVRRDVCAVNRNCSQYDLAGCQIDDFEFIDMSGKQASIPNVKPGMAFNCKALKKLAGSGNVYVRMTRDMIIESGSETEVTVVKVEPASSREETTGMLCHPPSKTHMPSPY